MAITDTTITNDGGSVFERRTGIEGRRVVDGGVQAHAEAHETHQEQRQMREEEKAESFSVFVGVCAHLVARVVRVVAGTEDREILHAQDSRKIRDVFIAKMFQINYAKMRQNNNTNGTKAPFLRFQALFKLSKQHYYFHLACN
jgi:hypothetical protein